MRAHFQILYVFIALASLALVVGPAYAVGGTVTQAELQQATIDFDTFDPGSPTAFDGLPPDIACLYRSGLQQLGPGGRGEFATPPSTRPICLGFAAISGSAQVSVRTATLSDGCQLSVRSFFISVRYADNSVLSISFTQRAVYCPSVGQFSVEGDISTSASTCQPNTFRIRSVTTTSDTREVERELRIGGETGEIVQAADLLNELTLTEDPEVIAVKDDVTLSFATPPTAGNDLFPYFGPPPTIKGESSRNNPPTDIVIEPWMINPPDYDPTEPGTVIDLVINPFGYIVTEPDNTDQPRFTFIVENKGNAEAFLAIQAEAMDGDGGSQFLDIEPMRVLPEDPNLLGPNDFQRYEFDLPVGLTVPFDIDVAVIPEPTESFFFVAPDRVSIRGLRSFINFDSDGDDIPNVPDNCPELSNAGQTDFNNNGIGDACELDGSPCPCDITGDGVADGCDVPFVAWGYTTGETFGPCEDAQGELIVIPLDPEGGPATTAPAINRDANFDGSLDFFDAAEATNELSRCLELTTLCPM